MAEALEEAHQHGVVHRDIKPSNVMLTAKGQVKILDFGLAQITGSTRLTKTGTMLGTPSYMSPEQAEGRVAGRRIGFFADGSLKIVDTASSTVQILCDAPVGRGGDWNEEGVIVFAPANAGPLFSISERGGAPVPVTSVVPEGGRAHRWPLFLPDGRRFLYFQEWGRTDPASTPALSMVEARPWFRARSSGAWPLLPDTSCTWTSAA